MGYRLQISFSQKVGGRPAVLLFANSHHPDIDLDEIVRRAVTIEKLPTAILASLLRKTYPTEDAGHRKGDPVFTIDLAPGGAEKRLAIVFEGSEELMRKGYVAVEAARLVEAPVIDADGPA